MTLRPRESVACSLMALAALLPAMAPGQAAGKATEKTRAELRTEGLAARKAAWEKIHAGLRLEPLRLNKSEFRVGEHLEASCRLVNRSGEPLPIPATVGFFGSGGSRYYRDDLTVAPNNLLGWERWWVRRKGTASEIKAYDREERVRLDGAYSNGQGVIQLWRTRGAGRLVTPRMLEAGEVLETGSFYLEGGDAYFTDPRPQSGNDRRPATAEEIAGRVPAVRAGDWRLKLRILPGEAVELNLGKSLFTGPLPPGDYELSVQFAALEGSFTATQTAGFTVR